MDHTQSAPGLPPVAGPAGKPARKPAGPAFRDGVEHAAYQG
ncbi:hypothetical protein AB0I22_35495 [Streptomyces sp. NPDC050610]